MIMKINRPPNFPEMGLASVIFPICRWMGPWYLPTKTIYFKGLPPWLGKPPSDQDYSISFLIFHKLFHIITVITKYD